MSVVRSTTVVGNIVVAFAGRAVNLLSNLIIVPLCLTALGPSDYGLLSIVMSVGMFFTYADFGLASALVNILSAADARGDAAGARRIVGQTWTFLWAVCAVLCILMAVAYFVGAVRIWLPMIPADRLGTVWALAVAGMVCGIPVSIAQRILVALQLGVPAQLWVLVARLAVLVGAAAAFWLAPSLEVFVFVVCVVPTLVAAISCVHAFGVQHRDLRPTREFASLRGFGPHFHEGLAFAVLNLCTFVEIGLDPIIFGHFFGPVAVAENDVLIKLYTYVPALASIALGPVWPAMSSAVAVGEHSWASRLNAITAVGTAVVGIGGAVTMTASLDLIMGLWLHRAPAADTTYRFAITCFIAAQTFGLYQLLVMNALGLVRLSALASFLQVLVVLPVKVVVLAWGGSIASTYLILCAWYLIKMPIFQIAIQRHLRVGRVKSSTKLKAGIAC